jgi:hypothetical protein
VEQGLELFKAPTIERSQAYIGAISAYYQLQQPPEGFFGRANIDMNRWQEGLPPLSEW